MAKGPESKLAHDVLSDQLLRPVINIFFEEISNDLDLELACITTTNTKCLLPAGYCSNHFVDLNSFNSHHVPTSPMLLFHFITQGETESQRH